MVRDQVGSPTWAGDLARGLLALARSDAPAGAYHGTNRGQTSWNGFAKAIFEELGADPDRVLPTDSASFVTAATRPAFERETGGSWRPAG